MTDIGDMMGDVQVQRPPCRVLVLGLGGGGCNAVSCMTEVWPSGPDIVAVHTDAQALSSCRAPRRIQIGASVTGGLSSGGDVSVGRLAGEADAGVLRDLFVGVDLAFIVLGLGGGTGTGAAPVIAQAAGQAGALTLCFATLPFGFEGEQRRSQADAGLHALRDVADAVVVIPNQRLLGVVEEGTSLADAFRRVDETMALCIRSIWNLLMRPGIINLDFSDLRALVKRSGGTCTLAYAEAEGRRRAEAAVEDLLRNPLFEAGSVIAQARGLLVGIIGGPDLALVEVQKAMSCISAAARPETKIIMGAAVDESWRSRISVTVLATETWQPPEDDSLESDADDMLAASEGSSRKAFGKKATGKPKTRSKARQERLNLEPLGRGRFKDVEPTIYDGADLDTPTFVRRGIRLAK